ncbi:hypothetical protein ACP26L_13825 [Paenibacillus sp. S-38]|uniref:hypothetical protein n=1 Tax=Paenibacillus sp. S-38 TaxID=3416710 RepID=UPI003CF13122
MPIRTKEALRELVRKTVQAVPVTDVFTGLYPEAFGSLMRWGIDELLTSRPLLEETYIFHPGPPLEDLLAMPKPEAAELVWQTLFIDRTPLSPGCREVVAVLHALGGDGRHKELTAWREYFRTLPAPDYLDLVFGRAGVTTVCMLSDPLQGIEGEVWNRLYGLDPRFNPVLSVDLLLCDWKTACARLREKDYGVEEKLSAASLDAVRSYLRYSTVRLDPLYLAASLPDGFSPGRASDADRLLREAVLPVAAEAGIPLGIRLGASGLRRRGMAPAPQEREAGPAAGFSALLELCRQHPGQKFIALASGAELTPPELAAARRMPNLHLAGCAAAGTPDRSAAGRLQGGLDVLGLSMTPLYSEAGAVDLLLPAWEQGRSLIGSALSERYLALADAGWSITAEDVERDAAELLGGAFWRFLGRPNPATGL